MPDIVKNNLEDIFRICSQNNIPRPVAALLVQQHEEIRMLQQYCTELSNHVEGVIDALKLSQALHKENKAELAKINKRYTDPHLNDVSAEQINEQ